MTRRFGLDAALLRRCVPEAVPARKLQIMVPDTFLPLFRREEVATITRLHKGTEKRKEEKVSGTVIDPITLSDAASPPARNLR